MPLLVIILLVLVGAYALMLAVLYAMGYRRVTRAILGFIPDSVTFITRLFREPRVRPQYKIALGLLLAYILFPFDIVPDVIPFAGQLDDALILATLVRYIMGGTGEPLIHELWPGPELSLRYLLRLARRRRPVKSLRTA